MEDHIGGEGGKDGRKAGVDVKIDVGKRRDTGRMERERERERERE